MVHDPDMALRTLSREHRAEVMALVRGALGGQLAGYRSPDQANGQPGGDRGQAQQPPEPHSLLRGRAEGPAALPTLPAPPVLEEIEPKLGELESLVVELPEEVLEAAREERDALEDPVAVDIGHERAQLVG